jgi:hypothetical protein
MKLIPILTGATAFAAALTLLATPARADDCGGGHVEAPRAHVTQVSYGARSVSRHDQRLDRQRRRAVRRVMNQLDGNRDGYISWREARRSRDMRHKFRWIDANRDGYIARIELNRHLKRVQRRAQRQSRVTRW